MNRNISEAIEEVTEGIMHLVDHFNDDGFQSQVIPLERLKNWARESYQDIYKNRIKNIITKLRTKQQLTSEDMEILEKWMIGDLKMYTVMERHYDEWITDLQELSRNLDSFQTEDIQNNEEKLLQLQGLILEIDHVLSDFEKYQYAIDRIKRYKSYVGRYAEQLTDTQRYELANMLKDMLHSSLY